jgi:hypothetical protein
VVGALDLGYLTLLERNRGHHQHIDIGALGAGDPSPVGLQISLQLPK